MCFKHRHKRIHRLFNSTVFWLSSYVASHYLAVVAQSGAKEKFYSTIYYINLNSNCCKAQRASKFGKNVGERVRRQISAWVDFFLLFKGENCI